MYDALKVAEEENPIKATVESVLPGVHLQFSNLHREVVQVKELLGGLVDSPDRGITGTLGLLLRPCCEILSNSLGCLFLSCTRTTDESPYGRLQNGTQERHEDDLGDSVRKSGSSVGDGGQQQQDADTPCKEEGGTGDS
jgi:hypothetical protein